MLEKVMEFAKEGKGRRLLNTLNKKNATLASSELDKVLKVYCDVGLPKEVNILKRRRGILRDDQYNALAQEVRAHCCADKFDDFAISLGNLLSSGMKMNPTKTNIEGII